MTEEEAKTKWCFRFTNTDENVDQRCIGSSCMAWRWANWTLGHDPEFKGAEAAAAHTKEHPLKGYCGLAGVA